MSASTHQLAASAYHLKPADVQKLLLQANNFRDRCLIKTLWWLGVRRSELITLDVRDFDKKRKRITVRKGKGSKTRVIPIINDEYLSDLLLLIGVRKTGPIFLSNRNRAMSLRSVAYLLVADNVSRPLPSRLPRLAQPVMSPLHGVSAPRPPLVACI